MAKLNCQSRLEISVSISSPVPQLSTRPRGSFRTFESLPEIFDTYLCSSSLKGTLINEIVAPPRKTFLATPPLNSLI